MKTPPSLINQKQTLFQKPEENLKIKKKTPRGTEAYQLAETTARDGSSLLGCGKGRFLNPPFIVRAPSIRSEQRNFYNLALTCGSVNGDPKGVRSVF